MKNRLFLSTLTLLGFGSCSEWDSIINEPVMYGVPYVDYRFVGEVTDAEGNPIKGIEVTINSSKDVVITDEDGAFKSDISSYAEGSHSVVFSDTDGAANGGEFVEKLVEVTWDDAIQEDGKDLFEMGTISLESKKEEK